MDGPGPSPTRPASELAGRLKGARYALWKNPANLTEHQTQRLAWIATTSPKLHRAYLLKEGLRLIFQMGYDDAVVALDKWLTHVPPAAFHGDQLFVGAARSSAVRVASEVRSSHLPSRWASFLIAAWSMRSSPPRVRRR